MCMTVLWVVNIGIDATFEHVVIRARLGGRIAGRSCQMHVQEGGNMAQIEEAAVSKLNGLRQKFFLGYHVPRNHVPCRP